MMFMIGMRGVVSMTVVIVVAETLLAVERKKHQAE